MKIDESNVAMNATHSASREREVMCETECTFRRVYSEVAGRVDGGHQDSKSSIALMKLLASLIEKLLGTISGSAAAQVVDLREVLDGENVSSTSTALQSGGKTYFDWKTTTTETIHERESTDFSARGTVKTSDGRRLDFSLGLDLCRDTECVRHSDSSGSVQLCDPLVLNFDGKACELSGKRFAFDLDVDGKDESIPGLAGSSGFLAIDRNHDGRITDGSELFGAKSGNGFADLKALDQDGNGWLDESDPGFASLRVWRHDASGADSLTTLQDEGVGAICLDSAASSFDLADSSGQLQARIRSSGLYLREDGKAGSMQQVDLSV